MFTHYEWLLIPAVGTFLATTFAARAAMRRQLDATSLILFAMALSMVGCVILGFADSPAGWLNELKRPTDLAIAIVGGVGGGIGMCCNVVALRQGATGPVTTIASMSILAPIALAYVGGWDDEPFTRWRIVGVVLSVVGTAAIHLGIVGIVLVRL